MNFVNVRVCSVEPAIVNIGSKNLIRFFHNLIEPIDIFHVLLSTYQISSQKSLGWPVKSMSNIALFFFFFQQSSALNARK